jgi:hypothetical protein
MDSPGRRICQETANDFAERYYLDQHQCLLLINRKGAAADPKWGLWNTRRQCLATLFEKLDEKDVDFLLLGNPGNLPAIYGLKEPIGRFLTRANREQTAVQPGMVPDVDVLVTKPGFAKAVQCLGACGLAPEPQNGGGPALYGGGRQQFFFSQQNVIRVHLFDSLQYTSLDQANRVGLHAGLQAAVFARRRRSTDLWRYAASINDSLLHNICRCLFDKRAVPANYAALIDDLHAQADLPALQRDLESVFFKFADRLQELLKTRRTPAIFREYIGFQNY